MPGIEKRAEMSEAMRDVIGAILDEINAARAGRTAKQRPQLMAWLRTPASTLQRPRNSEVDEARARAHAEMSDAAVWQEYFRQRHAEVAESFAYLAKYGRLTDEDAVDALYQFHNGVTLVPQASVSKGRASLSYGHLFRDIEGAVAFALLWLSEKSRSHWVIQCEACGDLTLVNHRRTKYCEGDECAAARNAAYQRAFRKSNGSQK